MNGRFLKGRQVKERIQVRGELILESPTHLGGGSGGATDMPLLRDEVSGWPLLTGASIAGALRSYLREYQRGYNQPESTIEPGCAEQLFGYVSGGSSPEAVLSWLMVDDALASRSTAVEYRDGVAIDPKTRTAENAKKFDFELLPAGTCFGLSFELWVPAGNGGAALIESLGLALNGLAKGEIGLGARKRRGFGRCAVKNWQVSRWPMDEPAALLAWLKQQPYHPSSGADILELLAVEPGAQPDQRKRLTLRAEFEIAGTLLIRSAGLDENAPDAVHLHDQSGQAVIPGTSLAGVLRGRALQILNTFDPDHAEQRAGDLFGPKMDGAVEPQASRLWVMESKVEKSREMVQSRVMIDRFTGGALPAHLFSEQPLIGGEFALSLRVENPRPAEVGLLLLLLKDLWTGDLPVGGEASVGRGRLRGRSARLELNGVEWQLSQQPDSSIAVQGDQAALEAFVRAFNQA